MNSKVTVISREEIAKSPFVVCSLASQPAVFPDDKFARCFECGMMVRHRPDIPPGPKFMCIPCFLPRAEEAVAAGELNIGVMETTLKELDRYGKHS